MSVSMFIYLTSLCIGNKHVNYIHIFISNTVDECFVNPQTTHHVTEQ